MTAVQPDTDLVTVNIDGTDISVPKGTLVIRAAELIGVQIPRFCDHPLLDPVGACRQCLVEVEGQRKPLAACTTTVADEMVVRTQITSAAAQRAQSGVMELLLINHPLDCPVCDKGGECPLQNQAMSTGRAETRFTEAKRTFPKPIPLSTEVLLDRERCVLCARCTRFSQQVAGDPFIELLERGALQQVGIASDEPFQSYFSGNTVQICPVGALTGAAYRFRARPFDLVSTPSVCEHCASGCAQRTDHRRGKVLRRLAGDDPEVNEEWNCDKGRWAFTYATAGDRITEPMVRDEHGKLVAVSWPQALDAAARGLAHAGANTGVLAGGRLTVEDAYAYVKFARMVLGTNNIDFRARAHSMEEAAFLGSVVAGRGMSQTYAALESAPAVLLAGFEPEEESPVVFLRLRKGVRKRGLKVLTIAPWVSRGSTKLSAEVLVVAPGTEPETIAGLAGSELLRQPGAVIMVGERLASAPGALSAAAQLADKTGAALVWVPRRAGERGALEAGALPRLLPGAHPVADSTARRAIAEKWGVIALPDKPGLDAAGMLDPGSGLDAFLVGGVELADLPYPAAAIGALKTAFVVSLEMRHGAVTELADVVLPIAAVAEKSGSFLNWEGRLRPFRTTLETSDALDDLRVLAALSQRMDRPIGLNHANQALAELADIGPWEGARETSGAVRAAGRPQPEAGEAVLASWRLLLDIGRLQDGEPYLAGTAHEAQVLLSEATANEIGAAEGESVTVRSLSEAIRGAITLPLRITEMPDRVVWVPMRSTGSELHQQLGPALGQVVRIEVAP
ncbi:NADH-quinone oxidoreductase subunit G [Mycobacteroides abscessus]|uniref:NADH-quinone oxidoreductase subunit G n=1 Tax=Mycobacteroides abscessus TaxID=36809 RepID=UPI000928F8FC|nr:NADH-quinone oxidoreductase subunit G [Mycobacteroides abscessus]NOS01671.1 NADH-quinone oxidoreductase subunit G [Mycobacteroides abscessus]PVA19778.1 NADH-quinone oxidoreductase subunit G [Mycobacteroides abscessus]RIR28843.1 NADH-quinone oxidoreductase subunit G [Mycobacteroides abscessus]SIL80714.1 NADH-quinone oxidoreductase, G subunit NuoG [Mycobacteroides abscessus subsp. abscessus]SLC99382.1 NADH-quinone oxidoreductase, G subunit NuoG [Mycobacteroides abscessus subsp. abscessus]